MTNGASRRTPESLIFFVGKVNLINLIRIPQLRGISERGLEFQTIPLAAVIVADLSP
ncbi:MAG: hypothetical protein AAGH73_10070 [Pseudomonadota bacterium]